MKWYKYIQAWWRGDLVVVPLTGLPISKEVLHIKDFIETLNDRLAPGGRPDSQDSWYQKVKHKFFSEDYREYFIKWLDGHMKDNPDYDARYFDCDDFAILYWAWVRMLYARQHENTNAQAPLVGYCKSSTIEHALVFAITEKGFIYYDVLSGKIWNELDGVYLLQF